MTLVDNEKFYSSIINLEGRRQEAGCDRQGPADAPGAQRHRAPRHAARRGDGEDPHPHPDPLQGRGRVPGREDARAAWCRTASPTSKSPACRRICPSSSSSISRRWSMNESKHLSDLPLPEGVTIPCIAKADAVVVTIHPPRAEEPEPTAEVAAATPAEGAAAPAEGAAAAGAKPGDAKAPAARRQGRRCRGSREEGRRKEVSCGAGRACGPPRVANYLRWDITRRADHSIAPLIVLDSPQVPDVRQRTQAHRRPRQSGRRIRAHAPQRGLLARGRAGAAPRRHVPLRGQAPGRARARAHRRRGAVAREADDLHESQRRAGVERAGFLQARAGADAGGARRDRSAERHRAAQGSRRPRRTQRPARHHRGAGRRILAPAHRRRASRERRTKSWTSC